MLAIAAALGLALVVGCGGDNDGDSPTATNAAASSTRPPATAPAPFDPTPTVLRGRPLVFVPSTQIDSVDNAIIATLKRDTAALEDLIVFTPTACVVEPPQGIGGPPVCREGEADGTLVDVLPMASCEGFLARPDEVRLDQLMIDDLTFYAVYRTPDEINGNPFYPPGNYAILFNRPAGASIGAFELIATDEGVTGILQGCGGDAAAVAQNQQLTEAIVAPSE